MSGFGALDVAVLVVYMAGVTAWGAWLGRNQRDGASYFLGARAMPWKLVMLSVVATETSTLTFLSIPGVSYLGSLVFLQLTAGYLLGRIVVAFVFLPAYRKGELTTAYGLLERRFGTGTRRFTSAIFMVTRLLADSVRLFATAIPLALITGLPYSASIAVIAVLTLVYTYFGGIKAVIWVDALQMGLYLLGAAVAIVALELMVAGGWGEILSSAGEAGKLQLLDWDVPWPDWNATYTVWAGVLGGAVFAMASHGTDHLIVQRLLTCRNLRASQKALVGSGAAVIVQFALFLLVGIGLWAYYSGCDVGAGGCFRASDEIFPLFIVEQLPAGLSGLLIAGVFAAAMSSLSSSVNSLASATAYDFWAPLAGAAGDDRRILRAGRFFTTVWAGLLTVGAIMFIPLGRESSAVEVALAIAGVVYGALLGAFLLAILTRRPGQRTAIVGMSAGLGFVVWIWLSTDVAWTWYVPVGATVTLLVGTGVGALRRAVMALLPRMAARRRRR